MSHNLSPEATLALSAPPITVLSESSDLTAVYRSRTTSKSIPTIRTIDNGQRAILAGPERKLLFTVLITLYHDIAHSGPNGRTYRDLTDEDLGDAEEIADRLGMPSDTVEKLVAAALAKHEREKLARRVEKKELGQSARSNHQSTQV